MTDNPQPSAKMMDKELADKALSAEWDVPDGRLGGVVRQMRYRANVAGKRANQFFFGLVFIVIVGILYYLLFPILQSLADGARQAQEDNLAYNSDQFRDLDKRRSEILTGLKEEFARSSHALDIPDTHQPMDLLQLANGRVLSVGRSGELLEFSDSVWNSVSSPIEGVRVLSADLVAGDRILMIGSPEISFGDLPRLGDIARAPSLAGVAVNQGEEQQEDPEYRVLLLSEQGDVLWDTQMPIPTQSERISRIRSRTSRLLGLRVSTGIKDHAVLMIASTLNLMAVLDTKEQQVTSFSQYDLQTASRLANDNHLIVVRSDDPSERFKILDILQPGSGLKSLPTVPFRGTLNADEPSERLNRLGSMEDGRPVVLGNQGRLFVLTKDGASWQTSVVYDVPVDQRSATVPGLFDPIPGRLSDFEFHTFGGVTRYFVIDGENLYESGTDFDWRRVEIGSDMTPSRFEKDTQGHLSLITSRGGLLRFDPERRIWAQDEDITSFAEIVNEIDGRLIAIGQDTVAFSDDWNKPWVRYQKSYLEDGLIEKVVQLGPDRFLYLNDESYFLVDQRLSRVLSAYTIPQTPDYAMQGDLNVLKMLGSTAFAEHERNPELRSAKSNFEIIRVQRESLLDAREQSQQILDFYSVVGTEDRSEVRAFVPFLRVCREQGLSAVPAEDGTPSRGFVDGCLNAYEKLRGSENTAWLNTLLERAPQAVLLLFLLATLGGLYRYNLRLYGFHHSRADILELVVARKSQDKHSLDKEDVDNIQALADALSADRVEFSRANTPTEQAVSLARAITNRQS